MTIKSAFSWAWNRLGTKVLTTLHTPRLAPPQVVWLTRAMQRHFFSRKGGRRDGGDAPLSYQPATTFKRAKRAD